MRKSVQKKQAERARNHVVKQHRLEHVVLWTSVFLIACGCALFISYTNWKVSWRIHEQNAQIVSDQQASKKYAEQAKMIAAQKAEAAAKAKIAAEMAAKSESERTVAAAKQTNPTTGDCGVKNPDSITIIINKKHCFSPLN